MTPSPRSTLVAVALGAFLSVGAAACGSGDGPSTASAQAEDAAPATLSVEGATIDRPLNPSVAAVRLIIRNGTATADTLVAVASPVAERTSVHRSGTDAEGRATMTPEPALAIPARSSVTFAPGGLHVMLTGIAERLEVGDDVELTLTFERAGDVPVTAEVVEPGSAGDDSEGSHDH